MVRTQFCACVNGRKATRAKRRGENMLGVFEEKSDSKKTQRMTKRKLECYAEVTSTFNLRKEKKNDKKQVKNVMQLQTKNHYGDTSTTGYGGNIWKI